MGFRVAMRTLGVMGVVGVFGLGTFFTLPISAQELTPPAPKLPTPTPDERARLESDPFFQSFSTAFDEVIQEETPELATGHGEKTTGETDLAAGTSGLERTPEMKGAPESNVQDSENFAPIDSFEAMAFRLIYDRERDLLVTALTDAVTHGNRPGRKACRSFLFASSKTGEMRRIDVDGDFDMTPGEIVATGRPLDAAIQGDAFFRVVKKTPVGRDSAEKTESAAPDFFFTRAGNFQMDAEGNLFLMMPSSDGKKGEDAERYDLDPPVKRPSDALLWRFADATRLASADGLFFHSTALSGAPESVAVDGEGDVKTMIQTGCLERSNARPDLILNELEILRRMSEEVTRKR